MKKKIVKLTPKVLIKLRDGLMLEAGESTSDSTDLQSYSTGVLDMYNIAKAVLEGKVCEQ